MSVSDFFQLVGIFAFGLSFAAIMYRLTIGKPAPKSQKKKKPSNRREARQQIRKALDTEVRAALENQNLHTKIKGLEQQLTEIQAAKNKKVVSQQGAAKTLRPRSKRIEVEWEPPQSLEDVT